ncbi:MAG: D-alanyl-D-alanine carboxypeptidase, partial [Clostridia bacterium]|nr:D-alanyl-D-alanine carboxypeptidase [Clostridia bacterium]
TNFVNPNGLPNDNHFTTAYDLAAIARYGLQKPLFREVVLCDHYIATPINSPKVMEFGNHNKLLGLYPGTTGVKTGYTDAAGRCFVSSAKRDNMEFIAVTLGDNDDWNDHMEMLDYAFANHHPEGVVTTGNVIKVAKSTIRVIIL